MQPVGYEQAVEKLDRDRAISNCRCHALHRTVPHIAGREDTRRAGLEQKRTAIERPSAAGATIWSSEDKALRVPLGLRWEPVSMRARTDHEEKPVRVDGLLGFAHPIT